MSKKVQNTILYNQPLYLDLDNGVTVIASYEDPFMVEPLYPGQDPEFSGDRFRIDSHNGPMPAFHTSYYATMEDLVKAMRSLGDLRKWRIMHYD